MKRSFYEESARVPLLVRLPKQEHAGFYDDEHVISNGLDLFATFCDYADINAPNELTGQSIRQLYEGNVIKWRDYVVTETHGGRMLCDNKWKYNLYTFDKAEEELYDLTNDPGETVNLAADPQHTETLTAYRAKLQQWVEDFNDAKGQGYCTMLETQIA
jgi:arylsulfatase A-like enzyme